MSQIVTALYHDASCPSQRNLDSDVVSLFSKTFHSTGDVVTLQQNLLQYWWSRHHLQQISIELAM